MMPEMQQMSMPRGREMRARRKLQGPQPDLREQGSEEKLLLILRQYWTDVVPMGCPGPDSGGECRFAHCG